MEFGIFHGGHVPRQPTPEAWAKAEHEKLMDEVAVAVAGDRNGFKYSWATEHHFLEEYSHLSASEVFLPFVAAKTERIHLGSGIFNLTPPVNQPARVAERVAMLDHLSEGRFEFGTGRGSSSTEFKGFGIPDGDTTRDMHDEALPEILRMWRETPYSYDGRSFSMPPRNVLPKPYTVPHPPLWIACGSPSTFAKAGKMGMGALCFSMGAPETLAPLVEAYKTAVAQCDDPIGDYVNDNIACVSRLFCFEDGDHARDVASTAGSGYFQSLVLHWLDSIPKPPGVPEWPELIPEPTPEEVRKATRRGVLVAGDPDECAASVQQYVDIGCDQIIFGIVGNGLPADVAVESMETFGKHVLPRFDTDLVHRTTRQREAAR
jgi:alkanesulfonate monooxygenase SsuD/methylene tetrahydromethanopterin reductase-like flavin-dependent oxidoreductase (luciferase family)